MIIRDAELELFENVATFCGFNVKVKVCTSRRRSAWVELKRDALRGNQVQITRRGKPWCVCWHGHRDVIEMFLLNGGSKVTTYITETHTFHLYTLENFYREYPQTGKHLFEHCDIPYEDQCDCGRESAVQRPVRRRAVVR